VSLGGPEKAGGGGSIPSLATIKSITYKPAKQRLPSETFQPRGGVVNSHVLVFEKYPKRLRQRRDAELVVFIGAAMAGFVAKVLAGQIR